MSVVLSEHLPLLCAASDGIQKLRDLVLELAIRGKLVPQDPNDEPASELLDRLATSRKGLVEAKQIRQAMVSRDTDMPPVNTNLPIGWSLAQLADLMLNPTDEIVDGPFGSRLKATEYVGVGTPIIRIQNIDRNSFKEEGIQYVTEEKAEELKRHDFRTGDVVLNKLGDPAGKTCLVPASLPYGIIVADIVRIRLDEHLHNKQYFIYCMNSPLVAFQFASLAKGVTRQRVNLSQVRALSIPLPPLAEQHRIVAKVDELMALCDRLEANQADAEAAHAKLVNTLLGTLTQSTDAAGLTSNWQRLAEHFDTLLTTESSVDALKHTILQLAVRGKLVPQDPNNEPASELLKRIAQERMQLEAAGVCKKSKPMSPVDEANIPFDLPNGWSWARFPEVGQFGRGKSKHRPRNDPALFNPGIYPLVQTGEVARGGTIVREIHSKYSEIGLRQSKMWPQGTLCITIAANIADSAILGFDACFPDSVVGFIPSSLIGDSYYFLWFMKTAREELMKFAPSTAQKNINLEILESVRIPLPPKEEIQRIVAKVDELMTLCNRLKADLVESRSRQARLALTLIETALEAA